MSEAAMSEQKMSYEQARTELGEVVQRLESGRVPLAESMALWERGEELARICQDWLDGARAKVAAARQQSDAEAQANTSTRRSEGEDDPAKGH